MYSMKYETIPLNKRPPFIVRVTTKILNTLEEFEINSGGFGKRQTDLGGEEYLSEPEPDVDIDEMVKDFADEEDNFSCHDVPILCIVDIVSLASQIELQSSPSCFLFSFPYYQSLCS
ncbi:hypothetical protein L2E82_23152 [Cichorium intybus]|uniref:Uncharacterized protein n=1 Tax=Cichorium intybus TaxID=13427 RepID=A0ACB9E0F0_CICIN|nr:hypothetical protein L2E82_23152 [Cichorium intybus]